MASPVAGLEYKRDNGDHPLKEEVEEEDGGGTAKQAVKHQEDFAGNGGRCGHPKPWSTKHGVSGNTENATSIQMTV